MKESKYTKQERFERMLDYYAVSLYLTYKLIDSGLLEKKIKVGTKADDIRTVIRQLIPAFASDLRQADLKKELIKDIHNYGEVEYFGSAIEIATSYFDELEVRGSEWENADLSDLFMDYKVRAERQSEKDIEDI